MLRGIVKFFYDFYEYITFLLLIILSFVILSMNEVSQIRSIQGEVTDFFSFVHYPRMWVEQLSGLVKENQALREENLRLHLLNAEMKEAMIENQRLRNMLNFATSTQLDLVPAKVLNMGTTSLFNSILIDVGSSQGIEPNMAVIAPKGIVGKTVSVGDNTTLVQIVNDINFCISVRFQDSRVLGIMQWTSGNLAEVREISKTALIQTGEKVITSGYSDIYPPGILIGEVMEVKSSENGIYQVAVIRPYLDINTVEEVFVVVAD